MPRYEFQDRDRQCGIVLQADSLSLHVSQYSSFDVFCSIFDYALRTVHSIVRLGLIDRIGLRYVDLVRPSKDEVLSDYLHQGLLGLTEAEVGARNARRLVVYQADTDSGVLQLRLSQRNDGGFLPPDIEPSPLAHPRMVMRRDEVATLLDFDHFNEFTLKPVDFSTEVVLQYLWRLHENTDLAFRAAVTDHALKVWGGAHNAG